jgi:hypothetical protein
MVPPTKTLTSPACECLRLRGDHVGDELLVAARQDAQADRVDVFVGRDPRDVIGRLAQAGVDHLGAGIAQGQGDDLGADVVAVEAGLGDQDAFALQRSVGLRRHQSFTGSLNSPHCCFSRSTISPTVT